MTSDTTRSAVPIERYQRTNTISWSRIGDADKRIVMHWLNAQDPQQVAAMKQIADAFGAEMVSLIVHPDFWRWLADVRAWQRERSRGADLPRPAVAKVAA